MVYKIVDHKYRVIVESLIITIVIFIIGFSIGFYFENYRTDKIISSYQTDQINSLDVKLQDYYYQIMDSSSCSQAITQNLAFADSTYNTGIAIQKYDEANQITSDLSLEKKDYVLLDTELWLNTALLYQKCNHPFDIIVYLYAGNSPTDAVVAQQKIISNVLQDVKQDKGNKVILIPIAGDLGLGIVNLQESIYNVTSFPSIIINDKVVLQGYHSKENIESYLTA